jgi:hypothetical protein
MSLGIRIKNIVHVRFSLDDVRHVEARAGSWHAEPCKAGASAKSGEQAGRRQACSTAAEVSAATPRFGNAGPWRLGAAAHPVLVGERD